MEQELGNGWNSGVHPDDWEPCHAIYQSSFESRRSFQMEFRLQRADGEYRWVLDNARPLYRGDEFVGFIGSCVDITEQKLIELRLRSSEAQLIDAQRLANLGSWERDIATERMSWSDEMHRISGLATPPGSVSDYLDTIHPKDRERVMQAADQARSSISPLVLSYRILRPDGEVRFVRSSVEAIRDDQGRVIRLVGAIQDTTEQFMVEERLRTGEHRLKNAERLARLGHWQWDLQTNLVSGSDEMYRIFGKPPDYVPSYEGFLGDLLPQDRAQLEQLIQDSLATKVGHSMEYRIAHPGGDQRTISCIWEVLTDEEGMPVRIFGTCQDITDSRRAHEESFARQKLETVGTLANGIAHDFNNLLGSVLAQAELALQELGDKSNPEEELKSIRDVAIRGSEIVRQLMIYAGKESEALQLVDVSQIVKEMIELLKVSVSKHATLETDLGQNLPAIRASAAQLRQVVMNLVTNASDAIGDQDGLIRVTTRCVTTGGSVAIPRGAVQGDYLQLEISDTGCGMSEETQARMFDPFFTTKSAGHGLGLAIIAGIVRGLGATMDVASTVGKGTILRLLFPRAETMAEVRSEPMSQVDDSAGVAKGSTLLLVEDEDVLREGTARMLRKTGFTVMEAADGSAAINLLREFGSQIDVILLDATIPGASSHEVVAEAGHARSQIKVILTSAYGQEMLIHLMATPQIFGFIRKPFQFCNLVETIRSAC